MPCSIDSPLFSVTQTAGRWASYVMRPIRTVQQKSKNAESVHCNLTRVRAWTRELIYAVITRCELSDLLRVRHESETADSRSSARSHYNVTLATATAATATVGPRPNRVTLNHRLALADHSDMHYVT